MKSSDDAIAIVGMAARLPGGGNSVETFWKFLCEKRSARSRIPLTRFNVDGIYDSNTERSDTINTQHAHFIDGDLGLFDNRFFGISAAEAAAMDPQQRILLETAYHALENAGLSFESISGSSGSVFVAAPAGKDYDILNLRDPDVHSKHRASGGGSTFLANRLSHFFNLSGPSLFLDTGCSGSLYALHLACQSLRQGESTLSIVGGSNAILAAETMMIPLSNAGFLSPDGISYSFDARANGYARGEGFAVIILKPVSRAIADGDTIRAVIRGTGANADGKTSSITHPSPEAQINLIRQTYQTAQLPLSQTSFFEAHGTGTPVGDPIEARVISEVFAPHLTKPMVVGAVKSNIGHTESVSGLAAVIKTVLALEQGMIPPNIWFDQPHPSIDESSMKLTFPRELTPWPAVGLRRASVNNFGYGGANGHVIIDDAHHFLSGIRAHGKHATRIDVSRDKTIGSRLPKLPTNPDVPATPSSSVSARVLLLSAAAGSTVQKQTESILDYIRQNQHSDRAKLLDSLSYTLNHRRSSLMWKSFTVTDPDSMHNEDFMKSFSKPKRSTPHGSIAFVFTGQGSQWAGMGAELLTYQVFRQSLESSATILKGCGCAWEIKDEIQAIKNSNVLRPEYSQPLITALQVALVDLLDSWNIKPAYTVGHSSGEIAAGYSAGYLSRESALKIAFLRGKAVQEPKTSSSSRHDTSGEGFESPESMLAVGVSSDESRKQILAMGLSDDVFVACINSKTNTTLSGKASALAMLRQSFLDQGLLARSFPARRAYHCSFMEGPAEVYRRELEEIAITPSSHHQNQCTMYSSLLSATVDLEQLQRVDYWVQNLLRPVNFYGAMECLVREQQKNSEQTVLVEVGPNPALARPVSDIIKDEKAENLVSYIHTLRRAQSDIRSMLSSVSTLYCHGFPIALSALSQHYDSSTNEREQLVDLPVYPFDHSQVHWLEGRRSRLQRNQETCRRPLVGRREVDWNSSKPTWTNFVRLQELPWILDHGFGEVRVYPASGFIVMAVEGARQIAGASHFISGYRLRNVDYLKPLEVNASEDGVECRMYFQLASGSSDSTDPSFDFTIYGLKSGEWALLCQGHIQIETQSESLESDRRDVLSDEQRQWQSWFTAQSDKCFEWVDTDQFYDNVLKMGTHYGPNFQKLDHLYHGEQKTGQATVAMHQDSQEFDQACLIHPTTLDAIIHSTILSGGEGSWKTLPPLMAAKTKELWLSQSLLSGFQSLIATSQTTFEGYREQDHNIVAVNSADNTPLVIFKGQRGIGLTSFTETQPHYDFDSRFIAYKMRWAPDVSMMSLSDISSWIKARTSEVTGLSDDTVAAFEQRAASNIQKLLHNLRTSSIDDQKPSHQRYLAWLHDVESSPRYCQLISRSTQPVPPSESFEKHLESALGLLDRVGSSGASILSGEKSTLEVIFADDALNSFYEAFWHDSAQKIATYIDLLAHKNPTLQVLEIGAGTGTVTNDILEALAMPFSTGESVLRCSNFAFTDISHGFLENAQQRYSDYASQMTFEILDICKDPSKQGFQEHTYDVVVAAAVLHATPDLLISLRNIRTLLKPGGKLILLEPCTEKLTTSMIFGLFDGWWVSTEPWRVKSPLASPATWNRLLQQAGFQGNEVTLPDFDDETLQHNWVIISSASYDASQGPIAPKATLVIDPSSALQTEVASFLQQSLQAQDGDANIIPLAITDIEAHCKSDGAIVSLLDLDADTLTEMEQEGLEALQALLNRSSRIVWSAQHSGSRGDRPQISKIEGLAKCIMAERGNLQVSIAKFSDTCTSIEIAQSLSRIVTRIIDEPFNETETEYEEQDGTLKIVRIVPETKLNASIVLQCEVSSSSRIRQQSIGSNPRANVYLDVSSPGILDSLAYVERDPAIQKSADVEVEIRASSLNFKDVLTALGEMPNNFLGLDAAGVVTQATPDSGFFPGDRVACYGPRAIATKMQCSKLDVHLIPDSCSFEAAASLPSIFGTAYHALYSLAHLEPGETILIHAGAGGVGQAAIQLAQHIGATIFTTASTATKRQIITQRYGISPDRIFSSRDASFEREVLARTGDLGVDVVLKCLSGELQQASCRILAPCGRFIEIGKRDIHANNILKQGFFSNAGTFSAVDLQILHERAPEKLNSIIANALRIIFESGGAIGSPFPLHIRSASEVEKAFRSLQSGKEPGKHIITFSPSDIVPMRPVLRETWRFDSQGSYVIAGGFGGLGRELIRWMSRRGARRFLVLSRGGPNANKNAQKLMQDLEIKGVKFLAPKCDIADRRLLEEALFECHQKLGPIRGCFQASMTDYGLLFNEMKEGQFKDALRAKVDGSWNLHQLLPKGLDFFILLTSLAGVLGNVGLSTYAAGNTFQNALARHRVATGENTFSLDLSVLYRVGHAADNYSITTNLRRIGWIGIRLEQLLAALEFVCDPSRGLPANPEESEIILGLPTPGDWAERGLEVHQGYGRQQWMARPVFRCLRLVKRGNTQKKQHSADTDTETLQMLRASDDDESATQLFAGALRSKLAKVLGVSEDDIDVYRAAFSMGVDSLIAVELRLWMMRTLSVEVTVNEILKDQTVLDLCRQVSAVARAGMRTS